jgi:tetratricopeptide (TPR) repeat protein
MKRQKKTKLSEVNGNRLMQIIIILFAIAIYANTLGHQYALDDKMVYWKNEFVQNGANGIKDILSYDTMAGMFGKDSKEIEGGRYRPLSLITFALEVEFFGNKNSDNIFTVAPWISHLINIFLYCISLLTLFTALKKLFKNYSPKYKYLNIPFIAVMLFAAHPLHTEVIANIKGRDEILAFLFSFAALNSIINYFDKGKKLELAYSCIFILLGAMSKEVAITFLAVIPISIYFFRDKQKASKYIITIVSLLVGISTYLIIREVVIGGQIGIEVSELMNNPFLEMSVSHKYATIVFTLLIYLKLLIFPHPLTWDYYPYHIPIMEWSDWRVILSLAIHLILIGIAIYGFKRKTIYSYAIIIYAATLSITSNMFFNIGAFMSERFLFMSLLGFCIIIAYLISEKLSKKIKDPKKYAQLGTAICIAILLAYSVKTIIRNKAWENSYTLFKHDVKISTNSAKSNSSYAGELYTMAEKANAEKDTATGNSYLTEAVPYFEKALKINPKYIEAMIRLGHIHYIVRGDYKTMFQYYIKVLEINPFDADVWGNTKELLTRNIDEPEYEKQIWHKYQELSPDYFEAYYQMGNLYYYSQTPQYDTAIYYYNKALQRNNTSFDIYFQLGRSYGFVNNFVKARENMLNAAKLREDAEVYKFLGITYGVESNDVKALEYFEKALKLAPDNEEIQKNILIARHRLETQL